MTRILLVDDSHPVRGTIRAMLASAGHAVTEAGDGRGAVLRFRAERFDRVLGDLFMPHHDGVAVIQERCREFPGVKIVARSSGGSEGTTDRLHVAKLLGAVRTLRKPVRKDALLAAVAGAIQVPSAA